MYNSDARQDQFVAKILNYKKNGTFVDIGSCGSIGSNNSFYFDNYLNWRGICIEFNPGYISSYSSRKNTVLVTEDATKINYLELFNNNNFPDTIDYLSLDVDTSSLDVLKILPFDKYRFSVITIEHDAYLYGDQFRQAQRDILQSVGYVLICSNVFVQQSGFELPNCPFEDWWVHESLIPSIEFDKIKSSNDYPSNILAKF